MTPERERELFKMVNFLVKEMTELRTMVDPIAPAKDEFLGVADVCQITGFSERKVRQLVSDGQIPYTKKECRLKFSRNAITSWMTKF